LEGGWAHPFAPCAIHRGAILAGVVRSGRNGITVIEDCQNFKKRREVIWREYGKSFRESTRALPFRDRSSVAGADKAPPILLRILERNEEWIAIRHPGFGKAADHDPPEKARFAG
jgi:hypothetical protein